MRIEPVLAAPSWDGVACFVYWIKQETGLSMSWSSRLSIASRAIWKTSPVSISGFHFSVLKYVRSMKAS